MSKVFANNLRMYRLMARMTQTDLANAIGITRSAVNNYESEKSEPPFDVLCRFADALGVDVTALVTKAETTPEYIRKVQVSDDESYLLDLYRGADATFKSVAIDILRAHQREVH